jgi:hypothetical protein
VLEDRCVPSFSATAGADISTTEGQQFSGTVATFSDPGNPATASDFTASIDWGDGNTDSGTITSGSDGNFTVNGSHTYADEVANGTYSVTISEPSTSFTANPVTAAVNVADADSLSVSLVPTGHVIENQVITGKAAVFTDTNLSAVASDFSATFDWGDGNTFSTAAGNATVTGSSGQFTVSVSGHAYADEGDYTVTVTLTDDGAGTATATGTSTVTADEGDALSGTGATIAPVEQTAFTGTVATFSNTGSHPNPDPTDFTATIDWGDGTTDTGTVTGGGANLTVSGTHTYSEDGIYTTTVTLSDDGTSTVSASTTGTANVAEHSLQITPTTASTTEGQLFNGTVAILTDPGSDEPPSDITATIDWGDGVTDTGTVSGTAGSFTITGSHTYADEGSFTAMISYQEQNTPAFGFRVATPVTVADADVLSATGVPANATQGQLFNGLVATLTDTGFPTNTGSDFGVTIDWGDGTSSGGTAIATGGGNFAVTGRHAYASPGMFTTNVTVQDAPGTASATASGTMVVAPAPPPPPPSSGPHGPTVTPGNVLSLLFADFAAISTSLFSDPGALSLEFQLLGDAFALVEESFLGQFDASLAQQASDLAAALDGMPASGFHF